MFRKVHVPLLGLVENMSYYCCPNCGHQDNIFGSGGVAAAADELGVELLGQVWHKHGAATIHICRYAS
jgi:ATP-binding protein involved in chromosome partitioning